MLLTISKPHRRCQEFGCSNLTKNLYCKEHEHTAREKQLKRHRKYNYTRDVIPIKISNSKVSRTLSHYTLASNNYLCVKCSTDDTPVLADVADHIIPITVDWSLRLDSNNIQPLCHDCHNKKTADDIKKYGRGGEKF